MGRLKGALTLIGHQLPLVQCRRVFLLPTTYHSRDLVEQLGFAPINGTLLLVVHLSVSSLEGRPPNHTSDVLVWHFVLAGSRVVGATHKGRHVPRSFVSLNGEDGSILHIGCRSKWHTAFVPALLWNVLIDIVSTRTRLERVRIRKLLVLEPALGSSLLFVFH